MSGSEESRELKGVGKRREKGMKRVGKCRE